MYDIDKCLEKLFPDLDEEKREVCVYGLELILLTLGDYIVLIAAAAIMGKLFEGILYLAVYSSIRSQAGGYHADSKLGCLLKFLAAFVISLFLSPYIPELPPAVYVLVCFAIVVIVAVLAPVEAVEIPISTEQRKLMKKRSLVILSICIAVSFILYRQESRYYICVMLAMLWNTIVLAAGKIKLISRRNQNG